MSSPANDIERLVSVLAERVYGARTIAVGTNSPIPAAAALLAQAVASQPVAVSILGSVRHSLFTRSGHELFDFAAQGRLDAFFLGGGQIDGQANINLVGVGGYPASKVRFPGSFGSAMLYALVPNIVLFRQEHTRRVLVPKVDFISALGVGPVGTYRPGGPKWLVTGRAVFRFIPDAARFVLVGLLPGQTIAGVRAETGFDFDVESNEVTLSAVDPRHLALLRGPIAQDLADVYPRFVARYLRPTLRSQVENKAGV